MGLSIDQDIRGAGGPWSPPLVGDTFTRIEACGKSFGRGIFKFHDSVSGPRAEQLIREAFRHLDGIAAPFAFDWLGRQYCVVDASATSSGAAEVVVLDPFDLSITPVTRHGEFLGFLSSPVMLELVEVELFSQWLAGSGADAVPFDRCASAVQPAFLGGERKISNLEDSDIEVYWSIMSQAARATAPLAEGEQLGRIGE